MRSRDKMPQMQLVLKKEEMASEQGFTLIEAMISLVILMISLTGIASLVTYAMSYNAGGGARALALTVAQQQMEQLRSVPFNDASLNATSGTSLTLTSGGQSFTVVKTIVNYLPPGSTTPTLKTITIQVTPQNPTNRWARTGLTITDQRAANVLGVN